MNFEYETHLEKLNDEPAKEVLKLTFDVAFQKILKQYENEATKANVFISFQELVQKIAKEGFSKQVVNSNEFYHAYTDFCDALFSWVEIFPEKETVYNIIDSVTSNVILDCIIEGLRNGSISPEDLNQA